MKLQGVVRGEKRPWRATLYGPPGVGKSTFGAESNAPIFVTTEDGVDNLPVDQFPAAETWDGMLEYIRRVAQSKHDYRTIVVDTLNGAVDLAAKKVCDEQFDGIWISERGRGGFNAFARGWLATSEEMRGMLQLLDTCRNKRGMNILLLAHTGIHNVLSPTAGEYTRYAPDIDKRVWSRWAKWCDVILRADYDYCVLPGTAGKRGTATGDNRRIVYADGDASQDAKARVGYELPQRLPLSYSAFADALGSDATALADIKELWHLLDSATEKKVLEFLGAKNRADIESAPLSKIRRTVSRLREIAAAANDEEQEKEVADASGGNV